MVSLFLGRALEIPVPTSGTDQTSEHYREIRGAVNQKNLQFFRRWRAHNGEYIYGRRASAWKIEPELEELERMILESDAGVWKAARAARGEKVAP